MISDVLSEAHGEIKRYLDDPNWEPVYRDVRTDLEKLLAEMERIRQLLDTPTP